MTSLQQPDNYETLKAKISTAAIVGHTTDSTAKIWVRAYMAGLWTLIVSAQKLPEDAYDLSGKSLAEMIPLAILAPLLNRRAKRQSIDQCKSLGIQGPRIRKDIELNIHSASLKALEDATMSREVA